MDMSPEEAQQLLDSNKGDGSSVISTDTKSGTTMGDVVLGGVVQGVNAMTENLSNALSGDQSSLVAQLQAAGLTPTQIAAVLGGGGSGGSSSGGGGGYSAPSFHDQQMAAYKQQLASTYFRLWGKPAPDTIINQAYNQGLNIFQFEDQIRQDPAFKHTETYQNEMTDNALSLARMLGVLPG